MPKKKAVRKKIQKRGNDLPHYHIKKYFIILGALVFGFSTFAMVSTYYRGPQVEGAFTQATGKAYVSWQSVGGAVKYNIYYKEQGQKNFAHAVRGLPSTSTGYMITYLKQGVNYVYEVAAVGADGREFWFSAQQPLNPQ